MMKSVLPCLLVAGVAGICTDELTAATTCAATNMPDCGACKDKISAAIDCATPNGAAGAMIVTQMETLKATCMAAGGGGIPDLSGGGGMPDMGGGGGMPDMGGVVDMFQKLCTALPKLQPAMEAAQKCSEPMMAITKDEACKTAMNLLGEDSPFDEMVKNFESMGDSMGGAPADPSADPSADPMDLLKTVCANLPDAAAGRRLLSSKDMVSLVQQAATQSVVHSARLLMDDKAEDVNDEDVAAMCKGDCIGKVMGGMKATMSCIKPVMENIMAVMKDLGAGAREDEDDFKMPDMTKIGNIGKLFCAKNSRGKHCGVVVNPESLAKELTGEDTDGKCALIKNMGCCWGNYKEAMKIMGDMDDEEAMQMKDLVPSELACAYKPRMCVPGGMTETVGEIMLKIPGLDFDKISQLTGDKRGKMAKVTAAVLEDIADLAGDDFDLSQFEIKKLLKGADGNCEFTVVFKQKAADAAMDVAAKAKEISEKIKNKEFTKTTTEAVDAGVIAASEKLTLDASASATASEESGGASVNVDVVEVQDEVQDENSAATLAPALVAACLVGVSLI